MYLVGTYYHNMFSLLKWIIVPHFHLLFLKNLGIIVDNRLFIMVWQTVIITKM